MGQELIEALPGTPVFLALSLRLLAQEEAGASFMPTRLMSRQVTCPLDGKDFDVTRERIRQIEAKALRKLRHPIRNKKLKSFVEF